MNLSKISKPLIVVVATTAVASSLGAYVWKVESRPPILEVYIFALSSGRSMFIRTPEDKRILIDGGSNSEVIREITSVLPFYSRRIDTIVATNTLGKNISGLIDVIERYDIKEAYIPAITLENLGIASSTDQIYSTFIDTLQRENIRTYKLQADELSIDQLNAINLDNKVKMDILFPVNRKDFMYSKASAPEILFKISFGGNSLVFLGNASNKIQKFIASTSTMIGKTNILIVSHSALPSNISTLLIDKLKPDYLVYSKLLKNNSAQLDSSTKKKVIVDPLAYITDDKKFNLKELSSVKITFDGIQVIINN